MTLVCINPKELEEGDLLAYVDGEAAPQVRQHIADCAFCQAEVAALQQAAARLTEALYREECPDVDALLAYDMGLVSAGERRRLERHVRDCSYCRVELTELAVPMPPTAVSTRVAHQVTQLKEMGKRMLTAVLQPMPLQPALALRGTGETRHVYQVDDFQIILVKTAPIAIEKLWPVEGQLLSLSDPYRLFNGRVVVHKEGTAVRETPIDELGYFNLDRLPPGLYTVELDLQETTLQISAFPIP